MTALDGCILRCIFRCNFGFIIRFLGTAGVLVADRVDIPLDSFRHPDWIQPSPIHIEHLFWIGIQRGVEMIEPWEM